MSAKKGLTTDQVIAALTETNGNISLAAKRLKVTRKAISYYIDTYATVKTAHDEAAAYISDIAEGHLVNAVMKGNLDQARYWLENKARDRGYGRSTSIEVTGKGGGPIPFVFSHSAVVAALTTGSVSDPPAPRTNEGDRNGP